MNETKLKLHDSELANNPNTRIPICIALDVSGSMDGKKIDELNRGVNIFLKTIFEDEITRYSADIAILTFGGTVEKVLDFGKRTNGNERISHLKLDNRSISRLLKGVYREVLR